MTIARDSFINAWDSQSYVLRSVAKERQRRSVLQPRVAPKAFGATPGLTVRRPPTLKALHHHCESPRYDPFSRVAVVPHLTPRVALAAQPWAEGFERRWRRPAACNQSKIWPPARPLQGSSRRFGLRRAANRHAALAHPVTGNGTEAHGPLESGVKATALQTLTRPPSVSRLAERLEGGAFTAAFARGGCERANRSLRPREGGVADIYSRREGNLFTA
jgi:hypothetical protein